MDLERIIKTIICNAQDADLVLRATNLLRTGGGIQSSRYGSL